MKKFTLLLITLLIATNISNAQKSTSPYEWEWVRDGIWTGTALGASAYGLLLIQNKDDITEAKLASLNKDDINFIDRWSAGYNSESASSISDIPFSASFILPFAMLFDDEINDHAGQFVGLYIESLATTASIYSITAGLVNRSRPYVYDEDLGMDRRLSSNGQRSFYSGHVAAAATATFFAAKVYTDFNPDAKGKGFIWAGAAAIPAVVGYYRIKAGQHFLTDVLLGYGLGTLTGILVPQLHKTKSDAVDVFPTAGKNFRGEDYNALTFRYSF